MRVIQLFQYLLHDGLAVECGLDRDNKTAAILVDCRYLAVIQIDNLTMFPQQGSPLLPEILGIHCGNIFLFLQSPKIFGKVSK